MTKREYSFVRNLLTGLGMGRGGVVSQTLVDELNSMTGNRYKLRLVTFEQNGIPDHPDLYIAQVVSEDTRVCISYRADRETGVIDDLDIEIKS